MVMQKLIDIRDRLISSERGLATFKTRLGAQLTSSRNSVTLATSNVPGLGGNSAAFLATLDSAASGYGKIGSTLQTGHRRLWLVYHDIEAAVHLDPALVASKVSSNPKLKGKLTWQGQEIGSYEPFGVPLLLITPTDGSCHQMGLDQLVVALTLRLKLTPPIGPPRIHDVQLAVCVNTVTNPSGTIDIYTARGIRVCNEAALRMAMTPPIAFNRLMEEIRELSGSTSLLGSISVPLPSNLPIGGKPLEVRGQRVQGDNSRGYLSVFARVGDRTRGEFPFLDLSTIEVDTAVKVYGPLIFDKVYDEITSRIADVRLEWVNYLAAERCIEFRLKREQNKKKRIFGKRVGAKCISKATFRIEFSNAGHALKVRVLRYSGVDTSIETSPGGFGKYFKWACAGSYAAFNGFPTQERYVNFGPPQPSSVAPFIKNSPDRLELLIAD